MRPGITDYASIEYLDENRLLGESSDPDKTYIEEVLPDKIRYNLKYINSYTIREYFRIIFLTLGSITGIRKIVKTLIFLLVPYWVIK